MTNKKAELHFSDTTTPLELPVISGTVGPDVVDVRSLVSKEFLHLTPDLSQLLHVNQKSLILTR